MTRVSYTTLTAALLVFLLAMVTWPYAILYFVSNCDISLVVSGLVEKEYFFLNLIQQQYMINEESRAVITAVTIAVIGTLITTGIVQLDVSRSIIVK